VDSFVPIIDSALLINNIKSAYAFDPLTACELDCCHNGTPSAHFSLSLSGLLLYDCCVYVPNHCPKTGNLRTHILQEKHDHPMAGHFSYNKTLQLLCHNYVWPSICTDCKHFILQCVLCAHNKPSQHHPYGLLQPLLIPEHLWHLISMDFIKQLLPLNGFTNILVIIDHLSKEAVFIPMTDNAMALDVADTFITQVFSKHRIPLHISSDCGSEFTSHFFHSLGSLLHMHLHFTSGHHPSTNSQVKCINSTLEQYLYIYCNYKQDNWSKLLPLAEFAYNNAPHTTTSVSPCFAYMRLQSYHHCIPRHRSHRSTSLTLRNQLRQESPVPL
jgi:hypothetical protein